MKFVDLTGKVFGRWTVLGRIKNNKHNHCQYLCRCTCGSVRSVSSCNLVRHSRSCGCLKLEVIRSRQNLRPYEALYRSFLRSATHPVDITYEEFLEFAHESICHYCDLPVRWNEYLRVGRRSFAYNLDRKDNKLGYTKDNCVVCCTRCNIGKSKHFTYDEWKQIGDVIRSWKK